MVLKAKAMTFDTEQTYRLGDLLGDLELPTSIMELVVNELSLDSRAIRTGNVFVALQGSEHHGKDFIADAIARGAVAVLVDAQSFDLTQVGFVPVINVPNLAERLGDIAAQFFHYPTRQLQVLGVTGTNGKSTCVSLLAQWQTLLGQTAASVGTLGYGLNGQPLIATGITTPNAIDCQRIFQDLLNQGAESVAMEVSSHGLAQGRVKGIDFDVAIFTNLSRDHLDFHASLKDYALQKAKLFQGTSLKHAVINIDDGVGKNVIAAAVNSAAKIWRYSIESTQADVYVENIEYSSQGITATIHSPWGFGLLQTQLLGSFNLQNLLAVLTALCASGASFNQLIKYVPQLTTVPGRMEKIHSAEDITVVIDYAHTPDALEQALVAMKQHTQGKVWCLFGCGGDRDRGKRPLMAQVVEQHADHIVVTSDNPRSECPEKIIRDISSGFTQANSIFVESDRARAITLAISLAAHGDCLLIAGKGHETYQIVGDKHLPFDDKKEARAALLKKRRRFVRRVIDDSE